MGFDELEQALQNLSGEAAYALARHVDDLRAGADENEQVGDYYAPVLTALWNLLGERFKQLPPGENASAYVQILDYFLHNVTPPDDE